MNTEVIHEGIRINLEMNRPAEQLRDGTWAHPAKVLSASKLADLPKLVGLTLWGSEFQGVSPTLAKDNQNGQVILLILPEKKW